MRRALPPRPAVTRLLAAALVPYTVGAAHTAHAQPTPAAPPPSAPAAVTLVRGTLVGGDGRPMQAADVALYSPSGFRRLAIASADSLGQFAVATSVGGPLRVRFLGVQHQSRFLDLLPAPGQEVVVDVRLRALKPDSTMDSVRASVARTGARDTIVRLARGADGVFRGEVPVDRDTASVRILGVVTGAVVPTGATAPYMPSASYAPVGWGDYRALLSTPSARVAITYDPRRLVRDTTAGAVRFRDTASVVARMFAIADDIDTRNRRAYERYKAQPPKGKDSAAVDSAAKALRRLEDSTELALRQRQLAAAHEPAVRQLLVERVLMLAHDTTRSDVAVRRAAAAQVDPRSPVWLLEIGAAGWAVGQHVATADSAPRDTTAAARTRRAARLAAYADTVLADPAVPRPVKAELLTNVAGAWGEAGATGRVDSLLTVVDSGYGGSVSSAWLRTQYSAKRAIAVGRPLPAFRFAALGGAGTGKAPNDTSRAVTSAAIRGRTVLMDFWAVWCGPCVAELPNLQKAYAKYKPRGLEVLSVSFDETDADVAKFRREKQPMPWLHARAKDGFLDPYVKAFEILGIPRAVLVGPDGVVLAADEELRGDRLDATLARALAAPAKSSGR